jgi:hypothetical protein
MSLSNSQVSLISFASSRCSSLGQNDASFLPSITDRAAHCADLLNDFSASEVVAVKSAFLVSNKEALTRPVATSLGHHRQSARKLIEGGTRYSFRLRGLMVKAA